MSAHRRPSAPFLTLGLLLSALELLGGLNACSDDAVGVELCRRLETARCHAANACGIISDATSCKLFYRDQCLHGFAGKAPSERETQSCVEALESVAECARSESCDPVCDAAQTPAVLPECAFLDLSDADRDDTDGNEGQGGSAGADSNGNQPAGASGTTSAEG